MHAPPAERGAETTHRFVHLETNGQKLSALVGELGDSERGRTLVFVRTKRGADRLVKRLGGKDVSAVAMHGNKSQSQRQKALARFDRGDVDTLVATDVAARGIDVEDITHVINFDIPEDADVYTHRTGRTGRAGRSGEAVSFVLSDQSREVRRMARDLDLTTEFEADYRGAPHSEGRRHNGNGSRQNGGGHRQNGNGHRNGGGNRNRRRRPART